MPYEIQEKGECELCKRMVQYKVYGEGSHNQKTYVGWAARGIAIVVIA